MVCRVDFFFGVKWAIVSIQGENIYSIFAKPTTQSWLNESISLLLTVGPVREALIQTMESSEFKDCDKFIAEIKKMPEDYTKIKKAVIIEGALPEKPYAMCNNKFCVISKIEKTPIFYVKVKKGIEQTVCEYTLYNAVSSFQINSNTLFDIFSRIGSDDQFST